MPNKGIYSIKRERNQQKRKNEEYAKIEPAYNRCRLDMVKIIVKKPKSSVGIEAAEKPREVQKQ